MSRQILIADDSQDTLQMVKVFLGFCGWEVFCESTAASAKARLNAQAFDLVILDLWLGADDGVELCRSLRARSPELPVVFLSGAAFPDDRKRAAEAGCNAFVVKPCDLDELARVVEHLVSVNEESARPNEKDCLGNIYAGAEAIR